MTLKFLFSHLLKYELATRMCAKCYGYKFGIPNKMFNFIAFVHFIADKNWLENEAIKD